MILEVPADYSESNKSYKTEDSNITIAREHPMQ